MLADNAAREKPVVCLSIQDKADRISIRKYFPSHYEVVLTDIAGIPGNFDLWIADLVSLEKNMTFLQNLKKQSAPVLLPVFLLVKGTEHYQQEHPAYTFADDILAIPCSINVFKSRVRMLLQTRSYSLRLRESQKRWKQLVTQSPDLIQITVNGKIQFINDAGACLYGTDDPARLIGRSPLEFISDEHKHQAGNILHNIDKEVALPPVVIKINTLNEQERYVEIQAISITYDGVPAIQTVGRDITDRIYYEQQLQESLNEKRILLQEIHHRVKNNLAVVSGLLELQEQESRSPEVKKILINNRMRILSIAKVHELLYQHENLNKIRFDWYISELVHGIESTFNSSGVSLSFKLNLNPVLLNIHQAVPGGMVINEILTNGIKDVFKNRKGGTIGIALIEKDDRIKVEISDDGTGLPEFFELMSEETLGTTIIRLLTEQLHGTLNFSPDRKSECELIFEKSPYTGPYV